MPVRKVPLVSGEVYHVYNRGVDMRDVFTQLREYERMMLALWFYTHKKKPKRLSDYLRSSDSAQQRHIASMKQSGRLVEVICYCLMPNHFHLLLRQTADGGISSFLADMQNSYTRYFNTKHKRKGVLFESRFKAVHVVTDEQLLHLSRYVHLNPWSAGLVDSLGQLRGYRWSSLPIYLGMRLDAKHLVNAEAVLGEYRDAQDYWQFVQDQSGYARELAEMKRLLIDDV